MSFRCKLQGCYYNVSQLKGIFLKLSYPGIHVPGSSQQSTFLVLKIDKIDFEMLNVIERCVQINFNHKVHIGKRATMGEIDFSS